MRWTTLFLGGLFMIAVTLGTLLCTNGSADACSRRRAPMLTFAPAPLFIPPAPAPCPEPWGTIRGRIVWGPEELPQPLEKDLLIDPKTKAVKDAVIWLMPDSRDRNDLTKPIPIHPDLRELKEPQVAIDIGNAQFSPRLLTVREGQSLHLKNKTNALQLVKIEGDEEVGNPDLTLPVPVAQARLVGPLKAQRLVMPLASPMNSNLSAMIWVFSHPYFCVTGADGTFVLKNAPAGWYRLKVWQPGHGWVVGDKEPDKFGIRVQIPAGMELDLGDLKMEPWK